MKKGLVICLLLVTGLFVWSVTAFASENVQQIVEAQHDKSASFIRLFISLVALVLFIAIARTLFLFQYYKNIFGTKEALLRIVFNSRSLTTTNVRHLAQNPFLQQYKQAIIEKSGQGIAFGLDTNILMHHPSETFELLKNEHIFISREVQKELDGLKNNSNTETATNARRAFKAIEDAQRQGQALTILPSVNFKTLTELKLTGTMDDRILAAYLQIHKQGKEILFLTNDRGAKITARNAGMPVLEVEQSSKGAKNPWTSFIVTGVFALIVLIGLVGYNAVSFFQAISQVSKGFSDARASLFNNTNIDSTDYDKIIEQINEDISHIYNYNNVSQFVEPTERGYAILQSLKAMEHSERAEPTSELRAILQPLAEQYYPSIQLSKETDETIQGIFYFGQKDIRFGLLMLNWLNSGNDDDLRELLAIDSSAVGIQLFTDYDNLDQVKHDIINIVSYGPFDN